MNTIQILFIIFNIWCVLGFSLNPLYDWETVTIPKDNHRAADPEYLQLFEKGFLGPYFDNTLSYRVVFHENCLNYPTHVERDECVEKACPDPYCPCIKWKKVNESIGSNENKLFGLTRGILIEGVMSKSCLFAWRPYPYNSRPATTIQLYGYGWKDKHLPPWETPGQNPFLLDVSVNQEYIVTLSKLDTSCMYMVHSASGQLLAKNTTSQLTGGVTDGVKNLLWFGGDAAATSPVTVSYSKNTTFV